MQIAIRNVRRDGIEQIKTRKQKKLVRTSQNSRKYEQITSSLLNLDECEI